MAEPVAVNAVMVWTSGSTAEVVNERSDPSFTEAEAGAVTTGGRSTFVIETIDVCVRVQEFPSSADHVIVVEPDCVKLGVPVSVMLGFSEGPAVAGPVKKADAAGALTRVWLSVTCSASGSEAVPVIVKS